MHYDELLARAEALPYSLPTRANRIAAFADRAHEVAEHAAGTRPILHARALRLIHEFLATKRALGSPVERALYASIDPLGFVTRLLARRPLAFLGPADAYMLRDGTRGGGGFEAIGTPREAEPLTIEHLLSYDEMALSALLGVSVPTHFINAGFRHNRALRGTPGSFEPRGIYVALVGARFERPGLMEWRQVIVTEQQNTAARGYGPRADPDTPQTRILRAWAYALGLGWLPTYAEAAADAPERYLRLGQGRLLNVAAYAARLRLSVEPFLLEAEARGRAANRPIYAHAVGLGLGVWRVDPRQTQIMLDVYAAILRERRLPHLADLEFGWFQAAACGGVGDRGVFRENGNAVRIRFAERDPAAALVGDDAGKLLVAMYAWDANAFPGNEYWLGSLDGSGDPAAACCSTIPELQNPDVNPRVSGESAIVLGPDGSVALRRGGAGVIG